MERKLYSRDELEQLKDKREIFRENIVSGDVFRKIIDRMKQDNFTVWSQGELDFTKDKGAGYNICGRCGELYLVSVTKDATKIEGINYRVCDSCIFEIVKP